MSLYLRLLEKEERFRLNEQSELLSTLLSNPSRGRLSVLRRAGLAMTGLEVCSRGSSGTGGGRIIFELENNLIKNKTKSNNEGVGSEDNESTQTPLCFKAGELVKIIASGGRGQLLKCTGTIERKQGAANNTLMVSISGDLEADEMDLLSVGSRVSLIKINDESGSFVKMKMNLEKIMEGKLELEDRRKSDLLEYMRTFIENITFQGSGGTICNSDDFITETTDIDSVLNGEQELAVNRALEMVNDPSNNRNLLLIHGPPGTGKTSVLVEFIKRISGGGGGGVKNRRLKILICGPSNLSVDNIVERLLLLKGKNRNDHLGEGGKILRIGHPSRVLESCQGSTLDFWLENSDAGRLLKDVQGEIEEIVKNGLSRCKSKTDRRELYGELKLLRQERRRREKSLQSELIGKAEIVACTLATACGKKLEGVQFDLAILDEAGQSLLPETLIAPILAPKLIMAGDHFQLPPTVMNQEIKSTLEVSLFEHVLNNRDSNVASVMLKEQYRMNEKIMKWSNSSFYGGKLRAHASVKNWKLEADLNEADVKEADVMDVLIFYDTCGFDLWESVNSSSDRDSRSLLKEEGKPHTQIVYFYSLLEMSKFNEGEAKIAIEHCTKLVDSGVNPENIAIISPYSAQVSLIRNLLNSEGGGGGKVEINSIDAFQGREKDAIILTLVRSNSEGIVGFLGELRRINVAMTRARKQLVIIGDSETLSRDSKLKGLVMIIT